MTEEEQAAATGESEPVSVESTMLSRAERSFMRMSFWQTVLSVVGVFIAVIALYAALSESAAVRQQTAASVWPMVQLTISDHFSERRAEFTLSLTNAGVGPARMQSMRVRVNGTAIRNWHHSLDVLGHEDINRIGQSFVGQRVLVPGETVHMVTTIDRELVPVYLEAIKNPETSIVYCYCSIFDACWLVDSNENLHRPKEVDACPDFGSEAFRN